MVGAKTEYVTVDGGEAAARIAHLLSEVIAIYPITPSSVMGELADAWSAEGRTNLWGAVPQVVEMQSEAGAAGALHGALTAGALCTTFTASQGLLLMLPNMFKIAGELTPAVFHVASRTVATHALSIFGDHSDVMAVRASGFAMLASSSVQEAQDLALVAHRATLESRVPFLHFFDGFRTSHEFNKIEAVSLETVERMIPEELVFQAHARALSPDHPVLRGSAQNPDVFFQGREAQNRFHEAVPGLVTKAMDDLAALTGRRYRIFDYFGDLAAERVLVMMGSGAAAAQEAVATLNRRGEKVGLLQVRLFRPFAAGAFEALLPRSAKRVAVLDRTKEPGASGEPLFQDVVVSLASRPEMPRVMGGRYGLSSKEFTPAMAAAVFDEMAQAEPRPRFTVGITDDVTHLSLPVDPAFEGPGDGTVSAVFYGLGSDGTVGANRNSVRIIGEETDLFAQGYFVYDSRKSGTMTVSHLRFGPHPIRSSYLVERADFVACHQFGFLERVDVLERAAPGGVFLLNSPYSASEVWSQIPVETRRAILAKRLRFFVVNASRVAREAGLPGRVNTVLQTCFFALSGVLPVARAIEAIKAAAVKSYAKRGQEVLERNFRAIDLALSGMEEVTLPLSAGDGLHMRAVVPAAAPAFVREVTAAMIAGQGDLLPVSALPVDGAFPTATSRWERRDIAEELPRWDPSICIDCAKCTLVCPHAAIRMKVFPPEAVRGAPESFLAKPWRSKEQPGMLMSLQVAPDDCTGCGSCADYCPVVSKTDSGHKSLNMVLKATEALTAERLNWDFFKSIPEFDRTQVKVATIKGSQMLEPLFEFPSACAGCGETPYLRLLTQMFGDRILVANATGCSSIYGGNLPTTPWSQNRQGRGPAWSNSLFEDNAEFGLGMRLAVDGRRSAALRLLQELGGTLAPDLAAALIGAQQDDEVGVEAQRGRVAELKSQLAGRQDAPALRLKELADYLVRKDVWIVGGDGWAYDIGYGGLDHVLASGRDVNILVLDTEVYSNTGGQASKATPRSAVAKFAASGKRTGKKDLGLMAAAYGGVYVAQVALGADNQQTIKAFAEAARHPGPSLIIAYSHCIEHGVDMATAMSHQKSAVDSGYWPLYRFDPAREEVGGHPFVIDSRRPDIPLSQFESEETRFTSLARTQPELASRLLEQAQEDVDRRWSLLEQLSQVKVPVPVDEGLGSGRGARGLRPSPRTPA